MNSINMNTLAYLSGEDEEQTNKLLPLIHQQTSIGSSKTNRIITNAQSVNLKHATITREKEKYTLLKKSSKATTLLNGKPITDQSPLNHNDTIAIGNLKYKFRISNNPTELINTIFTQIPLFDTFSANEIKHIISSSKFHHIEANTMLDATYFMQKIVVILSGQLTSIHTKTKTAIQSFTDGAFLDVAYLADSFDISNLSFKEETWLMIINRNQILSLVKQFLNSLSFFNDLNGQQIRAIAERANLAYFDTGFELFKQGDAANALYIVIFGFVTMMKESEQDGRIMKDELFMYERGRLFGELGLLVDQTRAASGIVTESSGLIILTRPKFQELVSEHPQIILSLFKYIASLLEEQSVAFWNAAQDIENLKGLVQQTKMAALGQLVAGVAHEINTPVGSINANSRLLKEIVDEVKDGFDGINNLVADFRTPATIAAIGEELDLKLDNRSVETIISILNKQNAKLIEHYDDVYLETNFKDLDAISNELNIASSRITDMVKSLGNFTRLDEAELKKVDIHEGLESTLSLLHHELKYRIVVEKAYGELPQITCFPNQLNQVFMNIIMNAIQAMEPQKIANNDKGHLKIETFTQGKWAVISITDNGKGMTAEEMEKIFDPYFSTKGAAAAAGGLGLGLGLSISQKIIHEKHQGKIEVVSTLNRGSTFFIHLPLHGLLPIGKSEEEGEN